MNPALKATSYTHRDPRVLPVEWNVKPDMQWKDVCDAVGFDPRGNEIAWGQLSADWNGHGRGAAVLTGLQDAEGWFTIVEPLEKIGPSDKPYHVRRRNLHRQGRLVAYEFAVGDPRTGSIYPASPRARCRPNQQAECRRIFQDQARAWAHGEQVPWSQYLPQPA